MKYVSWATFFEGPSDPLYFDVLIPRLINEMVCAEGRDLVEVPETPAIRLGMGGRAIDDVAKEACSSKDAFHLIFIHSDSGGRGLARSLSSRTDAYCSAMEQECGWPCVQCITLVPRHETEGWLLADGEAVVSALGYRGAPGQIGLPSDAREAERVRDPKQLLQSVVQRVSGSRRKNNVTSLFPVIAQRQDFSKMRQSSSFLEFEERLRAGLHAIRCI